MSNQQCTECYNRGKTWEGSDPKCGFKDGVFTSDNWMCGSLIELRRLMEYIEVTQFKDDHWIGVLELEENYAVDSGWVILHWYKSRGNTPVGIFLSDGRQQPLTQEIVEHILTLKSIYMTQFDMRDADKWDYLIDN